MDIFNKIIKIASTTTGIGSTTLKKAYLEKQAPTGSGVYKIFYSNQLMKVGKASDGLRKRFSDYYRGTSGGTAGLKYINENNRDFVKVSWKECSALEARKIETMWYDEAKKRGEELPWSDRR